MTKAIIFDLWGTIVENGINPSPSKQVRYFLRVRENFSDFIGVFEHSFMTQEFSSLQEGFEQVVQDFNLRIPDFVYEKLVGMWNKNAILSKMYDDVNEGINALKNKGYKVFLLVNIDKFSYEQAAEKFKLEEIFDGVYPSYKTGLLKSNPSSYEQIIDDNELEKNDVIMVGDSIDSDMMTAEAAGIKGILMDRRDSRDFDNKVKDMTELVEKL